MIPKLYGGRITIGRHPSNTIVLSDASVSRFHATVETRHGLSTIADTNSTNGTSVNGQSVVTGFPVPIGPGDIIRVGNVSLVVTAEGGFEQVQGQSTSYIPPQRGYPQQPIYVEPPRVEVYMSENTENSHNTCGLIAIGFMVAFAVIIALGICSSV